MGAAGCGVSGSADESAYDWSAPSHPHIRYEGRVDTSGGQAAMAWTGTGFTIRFEGPAVCLKLRNASRDGWSNYLNILIDGDDPMVLRARNEDSIYAVASHLGEGPHTLTLFKRTEAEVGVLTLLGIGLAPGKRLLDPPPAPARRLEFIGNSITCGYGNEGRSAGCPFRPEQENGWLSYAALTARALEAQFQAVCYSGRGVVQNYSRSRTGTMPQLYERILPDAEESRWDPARYIPDAVVINLGTNDFAHENPDSTEFADAYAILLRTLRMRYPEARIVCLTGPMLTDESPRRPLSTLKSWLDAVAALRHAEGDPLVLRFDLSPQTPERMGCDGHPNVDQHERNAQELTAFLRQHLGWQPLP